MVLHRGLFFSQTYFSRLLIYGAENHLALKPWSHMKLLETRWTPPGKRCRE